MKTQVSVMPRIYKTAIVKDIELMDVLIAIHEGSYEGCDLIDATNKIRASHDENQLRELKKQLLPAVMFNGTFSYKSNENLTSYSNITALDFDHFESEVELCAIGRRLVITPCVLAVYKTPSGKGLKAIILHDNDDPQYHEELYAQLLDKFNIDATDHSVSDLSRGNYICYDPNIWVNGNCQPYHFKHNPFYLIKPKPQPSSIKNVMIGDIGSLRAWLSQKPVQGNKSDASIISILNARWRKDESRWKEGNRANSVFYSASELCNDGVDIDLAMEYLVNAYTTTGLTEDEITYQALRGYQNNAENYGINRSRFDGYGSKGR
jgi:hypothetical protein